MKAIVLQLASFLSGALNGLISTGGGIIGLPILKHELGDQNKANCAVVAFILPFSLVSAVLYGENFDVKFLPVMAGSVLGGICGGMLVKKISAGFLKIMFAVIAIYSGVRCFI